MKKQQHHIKISLNDSKDQKVSLRLLEKYLCWSSLDPIGRFGEVDEVTPTALLLASEAGSYYVGQTLGPNGGDVML